ncbi:MAG: GIY-YIG nuclease family protein [Candidatus Marinimicrobia bacterium]|nr:GIY-YIG nuclease family protein [Candidatus Neomarinimicrobiota bacterium]
MCYTVYVLESYVTHHLYFGQTNNFERRYKQHVENRVTSTKNRGPWFVLKTIQFATRSQAMQLEIKLKRMRNPARVRAFLSKHY